MRRDGWTVFPFLSWLLHSWKTKVLDICDLLSNWISCLPQCLISGYDCVDVFWYVLKGLFWEYLCIEVVKCLCENGVICEIKFRAKNLFKWNQFFGTIKLVCLLMHKSLHLEVYAFFIHTRAVLMVMVKTSGQCVYRLFDHSRTIVMRAWLVYFAVMFANQNSFQNDNLSDLYNRCVYSFKKTVLSFLPQLDILDKECSMMLQT